MRNSTASLHRLQPHGPLVRARGAIEHPRSRAIARIGPGERPLDVVTVSSGRVVASTGRGWSWPNDEPDAAGELILQTPGGTPLQVRAVGWWSPLAVGMIWLDPVEALITEGSSRVHLHDAAAVERFLR